MLRYNGGVLCQEVVRKRLYLKIVILQKKRMKLGRFMIIGYIMLKNDG